MHSQLRLVFSPFGVWQRLHTVRNAKLMLPQGMHFQSPEGCTAGSGSEGRGVLHLLHSIRNAKFMFAQFGHFHSLFKSTRTSSLSLGFGVLHLLHSSRNGKFTFLQFGHTQLVVFCCAPGAAIPGAPFGAPQRLHCVRNGKLTLPQVKQVQFSFAGCWP